MTTPQRQCKAAAAVALLHVHTCKQKRDCGTKTQVSMCVVLYTHKREQTSAITTTFSISNTVLHSCSAFVRTPPSHTGVTDHFQRDLVGHDAAVAVRNVRERARVDQHLIGVGVVGVGGGGGDDDGVDRGDRGGVQKMKKKKKKKRKGGWCDA